MSVVVNPTTTPTTVYSPVNGEPGDAAALLAGTIQPLTNRVWLLEGTVTELSGSLTSIRNTGAQRLTWAVDLAEMAGFGLNDGDICLVPNKGIYVLSTSISPSNQHIDGVTRIASTWPAYPDGVWIREPGDCNVNTGYPIIGPAYPYDGSVPGNAATPSGRINQVFVPNRYLGTWDFGVSQFGGDGTFEIAAGQTNQQVTNSGFAFSGLTTIIGDIVVGSAVVWVNNHSSTNSASVQLNLSQNGTIVVAVKVTVRPGSGYVTMPFRATIATAGTLGTQLVASSASDGILDVGNALAPIDFIENARYGVLSIFRP